MNLLLRGKKEKDPKIYKCFKNEILNTNGEQHPKNCITSKLENMREIKFRGKKKSDGQWIIGDLHHVNGKPFIQNNECFNSPDDYEVIPESIGQYTDFLDKDLKEIYEGMKAFDDYGGVCYIVMVDGCFSAVADPVKKSYPEPIKDCFRQITVEA